MAVNPELAVKTISAQMLAKLIDVSLARVGQLAKEGVIKKQANGGYFFDAITQYIKFIRENKPRTDFTELLDQEKYRAAKRENDIKEKLVAPVEVLTEVLGRAVTMLIPILESLPLIIKRNFPEISGDKIMLVKKAVAEMRNTMADVEIKLED